MAPRAWSSRAMGSRASEAAPAIPHIVPSLPSGRLALPSHPHLPVASRQAGLRLAPVLFDTRALAAPSAFVVLRGHLVVMRQHPTMDIQHRCPLPILEKRWCIGDPPRPLSPITSPVCADVTGPKVAIRSPLENTPRPARSMKRQSMKSKSLRSSRISAASGRAESRSLRRAIAGRYSSHRRGSAPGSQRFAGRKRSPAKGNTRTSCARVPPPHWRSTEP